MPRGKYSADFETFWSEYPKDPLMSKKNAWIRWDKLDLVDRVAAKCSLPAFRDYCRKNPTYRPVHAERYLSQRRFDGFEQETIDPAALEAAKDRADRLLRRGKYDPMLEWTKNN